MTSGPLYDKAWTALQAAHDICFKHPDRDVLGMSHGPFSGVNEALGIISLLEEENKILRAEILRAKIGPIEEWLGWDNMRIAKAD